MARSHRRRYERVYSDRLLFFDAANPKNHRRTIDENSNIPATALASTKKEILIHLKILTYGNKIISVGRSWVAITVA